MDSGFSGRWCAAAPGRYVPPVSAPPGRIATNCPEDGRSANFLPLCAAHCALRCDSVRTWNGRQRNPLIAGFIPRFRASGGRCAAPQGYQYERCRYRTSQRFMCPRGPGYSAERPAQRDYDSSMGSYPRPHGEDQGPQGCTADLSVPPRAIRGGPRHRGTVRTGAGPSDPHAR
jgi:hypothetical protein